MSLTSARAIVLTSIFGAAAGIAALVVVAPHLDVDTRDPVGWMTIAPPTDVLTAIAWVLTLLVCLWMLLSSFGYIAARISGKQRALHVAGRVTLPAVRRAVDKVAAVAVSLAVLGPFGEIAAAVARQPLPVVIEDASEVTSRVTPPGHGTVGFGLGTAQPPTTGPTAPEEDRYEIETGDNLWRIACRQVRASHPDPTMSLVTEYWLVLIDRNTATLRSGDPDLVYPGEVLVLPAVSDLEAP